MNKKEEKAPLQVGEMEGAPIIDAVITKKRDTSFVDARKKQIELYGNYYPSGLSDEGIIEWCNLEIVANEGLNANLKTLRDDTLAKIESEKQAKLSALANSLSEAEKEQLKAMLA